MLELTPLSPDSMQIVWMKGHDEDIVKNVSLEYMYIGPCDCSDQQMLCQLQRKILDQLTTKTPIAISNLQTYSEYSFKIIVSNPAGSNSTIMSKTTLASSKL